MRAGRPKLLEVGAVVTFIGFVVVAFLADASTAHWVARYARGIAALILSLISFASLFFTPFTEEYAREQVPEQYWGSPKFKEINRKLTTMWACIFAAMVPFHAIAGTVNTKAGNIVFNWVIPLGLVYWGIKRSSAPEESDAPHRAEGRLEGDVTVRSAMGSASDRREHELRALVAAARWGAADPDVVEAIAARLPGGDGGAWVQEWTAAGGAAWAAAKREESACAYLHAASYYAAALALIDESDGLVEEERLWERQRECWDRAVGLLGGERLSIAYEHTTLPGYFFSGGPGARPLVVIDHGGRVGHFFGMGGRRGRGPCARVSLDDVRRAGPPGGAAPAGPGAATGLGGGARSGRRRDGCACGCRRVADGG